ncbi:hypothetical protein AALP_AA4G036900 [Arabis alpina]|uniref:Uncharacterized protein n=1 Tax=Arabis alpina TaxID=50452 RepID=A0A087H0Y9_ARAAL|nr:hypothetical protein AALP_AA4G036900 [Arabis alpina]
MICGSFFKPKFYKKCKHSIKNIKIELDSTRKKKNAMVYYLKRDIAEILKTGHENEDKAYKKVEELLEELRILSSYDLIERFCDFISSNLSLMMNQRECPEECREAVSSLIYATAWVRYVPELKHLRALFKRRYGNSIDSYLVEKLVWRKPSREVRAQKLQEIAQEYKIIWSLDSSKGSSSYDSSSSSSTKRRESVKNKKKIFPYGLISPPYKKHENTKNKKSIDEENSRRLLGSQGSVRLTSTSHKVSLTEDSKKTSSFQRPKFLDYDEVVDRLATLRER